jgi:outer membrane protein assembly factor BamD
MLRSFIVTFGLTMLLGAADGCGSSVRGTGGDVTYDRSAKKNYELGMAAMADEEYVDASKYFTFIKARFPYSKFAVLSDLRVADCAFGAGAFLEAVDGYKQFIKFHPTHALVENGYAAFKIGESYYRMLPDDWFVMPPAYERDQSATNDALRELTSFERMYPKSELNPKAEKMRKACAHQLAAYEWYVADYYWKRNLPMGTVLRLRALIAKYPDAGYDQAALLRLGDAFVKVGRKEDARRAWQTLIANFPRDARAGQATGRLKRLGATK